MEANGMTVKTEPTDDGQFSFNLKTEDGEEIVIKKEYENIDEGTCAAVDVKLEADVQSKTLLRKVLGGNDDQGAGLDVSPYAVVLQSEKQEKPSINSQELEIKKEKGLEDSFSVRSIGSGDDEDHHTSNMVVSNDAANIILKAAKGTSAGQDADTIKIVFDISGKLKEWRVGNLSAKLPTANLNKVLMVANMSKNSNLVSTRMIPSTSSRSTASPTSSPPPTKRMRASEESDGEVDGNFHGFKCKICDREYLNQMALTTHQKIHHLALSGLPGSCLTFNNPRSLPGIVTSSPASSTPFTASSSRAATTDSAAKPTPVFMVSSEAAGKLSKELNSTTNKDSNHLKESSKTKGKSNKSSMPSPTAEVPELMGLLLAPTTTKSSLLAAAVQGEVEVGPATSRTKTQRSLPRASKHGKEAHKEPRQQTSYGCEFCDKIFRTYVQLNMHMKIHNPFMCGVCDNTYKLHTDLTCHLLNHEDPTLNTHVCFTCSFCSEEFESEEEMQDHLKTHGDVDIETVYECGQCGQELNSSVELKIHLQSHMGNLYQPCRCGVCLISFSAVADLRNHLADVHFVLANYMCKICKCRFSTAEARNAHMPVHESVQEAELRKQRRWKCQYCPLRYPTELEMLDHSRLSHTKSRFFDCSFCPSSFVSQKKLQAHVKTHSVVAHFL